MAEVAVNPVDSRRQQRQFLDLPRRLHAQLAPWIPRLRATEAEMAGFRSHPFHEQALVQAFLAERNRRVCGRVVAIVNRAHQQYQKEPDVGFLGFFEAEDDARVAGALFDAARDWLLSQGVTRVRGPVNPSMNYEAGLLVDGHHLPPTFMMPYNPAYYERLWTEYGFHPVQDLYAFYAHKEMLVTMNQKVEQLAYAAKDRYRVSFRQLDPRRFHADVQSFLHIYNRASAATWGFVPLSQSEIVQLSRELRYLIIPELTAIATVDDKIVGAVFGMLDYNPRIRRIRGKLFPLGFVRLLTNRQGIKKARVLSANILPEYQRWGLGLALLGRLAVQGVAWGLEEVEFSYVLESNFLARASLQKGGAKCERTYRIYDKDLR